MAKVATDFEKIINQGRERRRNEALAQQIFSRDRRQSAPSTLKPGAGPSLASRVGVKKRVSSQGPRTTTPTPGNIDGEWAHDLHATVNGGKGPSNSLASRLSAPKGPASKRVAAQRANRIASALDQPEVSQQANIRSAVPTGPRAQQGLSIRGLAGPFAVMAQNFAPGTTAADIESAMTPVGGEMLSCVIVKTSPFILAEMVFASKEGADIVISTFNNQTADGRILKVYPKPGGYQSPASAQPRRETRSSSNIIDASMGFPDPMDEDLPRHTPTGPANPGLYSDKMVGNTRRGRGFRGGTGGGR